MSWIVVRVRSNVNVERSIRETMDYLNLTKVNHAVIIPENDQYRGMLQKAKDYITWGEADEGTVQKMLSERGRMSGDAPLTDEVVKETTDFKNITEFAKAITNGILLSRMFQVSREYFDYIHLEGQKDGAVSNAHSL